MAKRSLRSAIGLGRAASTQALALLALALASGCGPATTPDRARNGLAAWVSVDLAPLRRPEALRFDLRDPAEQQRWRLRNDIEAARSTSEGLSLRTTGPDPHLSRPLPHPIDWVERVEVRTARPLSGELVVYPRIGGVEREEWAVRTHAADASGLRHVAAVGSVGWAHGAFEAIRIDPPDDATELVLSEVVLEPADRWVVRRRDGEARECLPATAVRTRGPLGPTSRMAIAFGTWAAAEGAEERAAVELRVSDPASGSVIARAPLRLDSASGWHRVVLAPLDPDRTTPEHVDVALVEAGSDTERPACFARPVVEHDAQLEGATPSRPNVLLVSLDTLRADGLARAPFLRGLASRGRSFDRTWASASWTLPSHVSLFTSTPVLEHDTPRASERRPFTDSVVPRDLPMLAEVLAAAGYRTGATTGGGYVAPEYGFVRGFERYRVGDEQGTDAFAGHLAFVSDFVEASSPGPFFLFVHTYAVHDYFLNDATYHDLVDPVEDAERMRAGSYLEAITSGRASPVYARRLYDGGIARADRFVESLVGRVLEQTGGRPLLVIVTSDHGESFGEQAGVWHHGTSLEDEQLRVPLIVWGSFEGAPGGGPDDSPSSTLDVAPSLLTFLGLPVPSTFRGARDRLAARPARDRAFPVVASTPHTTRPGGARRLDQAIVSDPLEYLRSDEPDGRTSSEACRERPGDGVGPARALPVSRCARLAAELASLYERLGRRVLVARPGQGRVDLDVDLADTEGEPIVHAGIPSGRAIRDAASGRLAWQPASPGDRLFVHVDRPPRRVVDRDTGRPLVIEGAPSSGTSDAGDEPAAGATGLRLRWLDVAGAAGDAPDRERGRSPSPALRERLEALGYTIE